MKIAIIGGGNVGRVLSVLLDTCGNQVKLVASRKPRTISIGKHCMYNITGDFGRKSHLVQVVEKLEDLDSDNDIIFVCTKLFDAIDILKNVKNKIKKDGAIVTIQNMFWIDRASIIIPPENAVFACFDFTCMTSDCWTMVKNIDGIKLGIIDKAAYGIMKKVADVLGKLTSVEIERDIVGFSVGRNILNIAISLLGGVSGLNIGKILENKIGKRLFVKIIQESMDLFDSMNINIVPYNDQLNYYMFREETHKSKLYRKRMIKILRKNNYNVTSSILYDLQHNIKSEILVVVKSFIKHAQIRKIKISTIIKLYKMIIQISHNERRVNNNVFNEFKHEL